MTGDPEHPARADDDGGNGRESARISRIERADDGTLRVHLVGADEPLPDAKVARCFPWSLPDAYLSVRNKEGKEVALLQGLDDLDPDSRGVVETALREGVFNPKILRLCKHKREFGITSITAETDRGEVTFQIRSRDDVRVLSPTRALFRDADGILYQLDDLTRLDPASQKFLAQYF